MTFSIACRTPDGNRHHYLSAFRSKQRGDMEMTSKQRGALSHPDQAHGLRIGDFVARNASPVVSDLKKNLPVGLA